ncbi:hypothetical protein LUTEI9C_100209 [Luteimonas sp. 9C]|nr:hypothetical protein LUTEI9C_100209 [Luteimonas sp. 9C]
MAAVARAGGIRGGHLGSAALHQRVEAGDCDRGPQPHRGDRGLFGRHEVAGLGECDALCRRRRCAQQCGLHPAHLVEHAEFESRRDARIGEQRVDAAATHQQRREILGFGAEPALRGAQTRRFIGAVRQQGVGEDIAAGARCGVAAPGAGLCVRRCGLRRRVGVGLFRRRIGKPAQHGCERQFARLSGGGQGGCAAMRPAAPCGIGRRVLLLRDGRVVEARVRRLRVRDGDEQCKRTRNRENGTDHADAWPERGAQHTGAGGPPEVATARGAGVQTRAALSIVVCLTSIGR